MSRLGYLALGMNEVQRLSQEKGLDLDLTMAEIIGLGRTVYDRYRAKGGDDKVLDPIGLAILEQIVDRWHESLAEEQHRLDHERGQAHNHARLLELGLDPDLAHARG